jgi:hypothetical protein
MSVGDAYTERVAPCIQSIKSYCETWSLDFHLATETLDESRPIPWSKIKHVQTLLQSGKYDIVLWVDADVLVLNKGVSFDELLVFFPKTYSFLLAADANTNTPNTGVFAIQCTPVANSMLDEVYSKTDFIKNEWWEQAAFIHCMTTIPSFCTQVRVLPAPGSRLLNAFPPWFGEKHLAYHARPDDWLVHFAGKRDDMFTYFMNLYDVPQRRQGLTHDRLSLLASTVRILLRL